MENSFVNSEFLAKNILSLFSVDTIETLKENMLVYENNIYKYNNKYYKCIKSGIQSLPSAEYFEEININNKEKIKPYVKLEQNTSLSNDNGYNRYFNSLEWTEVLVLTKYYEEYKISKFIKNDIEFLELMSDEVEKPIQIYTTDTNSGYATEVDILFYSNNTIRIKRDGNLDNKNFQVQVWIR